PAAPSTPSPAPASLHDALPIYPRPPSTTHAACAAADSPRAGNPPWATACLWAPTVTPTPGAPTPTENSARARRDNTDPFPLCPTTPPALSLLAATRSTPPGSISPHP